MQSNLNRFSNKTAEMKMFINYFFYCIKNKKKSKKMSGTQYNNLNQLNS